MDLKHYYRKLRDAEQSFSEEYPIITSLETSDGGKAGRVMEVSRAIAAKMIVDGRAVLANSEQREAYAAAMETARIAAQKADLARRLQLAIVTGDDLETGTQIKKR